MYYKYRYRRACKIRNSFIPCAPHTFCIALTRKRTKKGASITGTKKLTRKETKKFLNQYVPYYIFI